MGDVNTSREFSVHSRPSLLISPVGKADIPLTGFRTCLTYNSSHSGCNLWRHRTDKLEGIQIEPTGEEGSAGVGLSHDCA